MTVESKIFVRVLNKNELLVEPMKGNRVKFRKRLCKLRIGSAEVESNRPSRTFRSAG